MFKHIGRKIKVLAQINTWVGIIASILLGIGAGVSLGVTLDEGVVGALLGILVAVLGGLLSWVGNFLLYGFGQLIDNSDKMAESLNEDTNYPGYSCCDSGIRE